MNKIEYVAYNYFPPNNVKYTQGIVEAMSTSQFQLSHLGKNDPPKKWNGNELELFDILSQGTEMTNYTFAKDAMNKLEIDFALGNSEKAFVSTISISGKNREMVELLCVYFAKYVESYLCISDQLGLGKTQSWAFLLKNESCPASILDQLKIA